eukprot:scaffold95203_cov32-Prasinocladus_malaysianus.AAC.4
MRRRGKLGVHLDRHGELPDLRRHILKAGILEATKSSASLAKRPRVRQVSLYLACLRIGA